MQAHEIEHYLAELGAALESQGISKPVRLLLIGGAYMMLLANAPRTTDDIDICWLEEGEDFHKARLALRDAVQAIARRYTLPPNWFNYLTHLKHNRTKPKPSRPHSTCCSDQKGSGSHDAKNASHHGTGIPRHLCWGRPLDGSGEL